MKGTCEQIPFHFFLKFMMLRYAADLKAGTRVMVWGRIQSREYKKRIEENETQKRIAYEVSINTLEVA